MNLSEPASVRYSLYLGGFVVLFIILGLGYSTLTPIFENSDETLHYPYVKHIADGHGLPLAVPDQLWNQEGTQPPLYYAIVAATTFWIDTDNLLDHLQRNPHWLFTEVRTLINDNQNLVLHGPMDAFPYTRTALAVHIGRWWSLLFGAITVICTFYIGRHFFPHNLPLVITATALTALTPQFLRVSATVSNDSLSAALTSLTVLVALKATQPSNRLATFPANQSPNPPPNQPANQPTNHLTHHLPPLLLGLLSGLALLTKLSSLMAAVLAAYIIIWQFLIKGRLDRQTVQKTVLWLFIIGAVTIALSSWWFLRNYRLYGEWLATETHLNLAGRGELSLSEIWGLRAEIARAYWATFGWGQIRPPEWVFTALNGLAWLGVLGVLIAVVVKLTPMRGQHTSKSTEKGLFNPSGNTTGTEPQTLTGRLKQVDVQVILFLAFWLSLSLILYARWVMEVGSVSHTRLIFPSITAISLLLALGWHTFLPNRIAMGFSGLVTAGLIALNVYSLGGLIYPAFTPNSQPITGGLPVNLTFLDSLQITAAQVEPLQPNDSSAATAGDAVAITVQWQPLQPIPENYSVATTLLAPDGQVLSQRETYPGLGLRPTRYLTPGDTFTDIYPLQLDRDVAAPMAAQAIVTLFDFNSDTRTGFPAIDANGNTVTPIVGYIKVVPTHWPEYQPTYPAAANFNNAIALTGYDLDPLTLYWESLAPVNEDYNLFVHLFDDEGNLISQADAPPTQDAYPTHWWEPGEIIADRHSLPTAPGATRVRIGFYSLITEQRLPLLESTLPAQDNSVEIELTPVQGKEE